MEIEFFDPTTTNSDQLDPATFLSHCDRSPVYIMGFKIEPGDYERMVRDIAECGEIPSSVLLMSSEGGDLGEAMKIGRLFRQGSIRIHLIGLQDCASACFFILVGSPDRQIDGSISLHRPYYERSYFSGLELDEAERRYAELQDLARAYLFEMDVPNHIIERMFAIPSGEVERLSVDDIDRFIDGRTPAYGEWLAAKCGRVSREERRDYWQAVVRSQEGFSEGYVKYLTNLMNTISPCEHGEIDPLRKELYLEIIP